jgi:hypothetical protein
MATHGDRAGTAESRGPGHRPGAALGTRVQLPRQATRSVQPGTGDDDRKMKDRKMGIRDLHSPEGSPVRCWSRGSQLVSCHVSAPDFSVAIPFVGSIAPTRHSHARGRTRSRQDTQSSLQFSLPMSPGTSGHWYHRGSHGCPGTDSLTARKRPLLSSRTTGPTGQAPPGAAQTGDHHQTPDRR